MAYVGEWVRLSEALARVMEATGISSKDEAQADICHAVADRRIRIRGELGRLRLTHTTSAGTVLTGEDFEIPTNLGPEDLDWAQSRPLKEWFVRRDRFRPHGFWSLQRIELSRTDVTNVLCTAKEPDMSPATSTSRAALEGEETPVGPGAKISRPVASAGCGWVGTVARTAAKETRADQRRHEERSSTRSAHRGRT